MTTGPKRETYDVVVIGAAPAGLAAAATSARAGLSTLLLDENIGPGGQVYRAIASTPVTERGQLGADYWAGADLVQALRASNAEVIQRATVWSLDRNLDIGISVGGASAFVNASRVILATGALERPFPVPGWTLPGVMTAGAAQILRLGGRLDCILDTTARGNYLAAIPHAFAFLTSPYFAKGLAMMREVRAKVRVVCGVTELASSGDGRLASVSYVAGGKRGSIAADLLLLHQGVVPNVNLAMAAGAEHRWDELQLCWAPVLDANSASSVAGIAIAGDGAGIGGAGAAEVRGRIAARAAVESLAPAAAAGLPPMAALRADLAKAERGRAFLDTLFRPAPQFRIPSGDTIVCRCEEVTAKDILDAVAIGATGPNQLKAYRRTGMGPCQGRLCGLTVTELMAQARDKSPQEIGYYRLRAPVKPITLAELASVAKTDTDVKAVVRG